jgi:hypothetical protein
LQRIAKVPKREFIRRGINQHTLEKICNKNKKEAVRASKLAKAAKVLQEWESEQEKKSGIARGNRQEGDQENARPGKETVDVYALQESRK